MPHIAISMYPGRSEAQKRALADAVKQSVVGTLSIDPKLVTVSLREVKPEDWDAMYRAVPENELLIPFGQD